MYFDKLSNLGIKLRRRSGNEKTTCPKCSDGRRNKKDPCLSVNITEGIYNCHNCGWKGNVKNFDRSSQKKNYSKPDASMFKHIDLSEKIVKYFEGRCISRETLTKFMVHGKEEFMPQTQKKERVIVFPYLRDGEIVNAKYRDAKKNFRMIKDAELIFFGMQTLKGRHCAIIQEGECFHPTAEVLTKNGWVSFENWNGEDVAQYKDGVIEFVKPKALVRKEFNGELIEFSNVKRFYSLTTPEHNMVFYKKWEAVKIKANEIPSDHRFYIPRVAFHDGAGLKLSDDEIRFCIAVSADFTLRATGDLYCGLKKERKKERLVRILESIGVKYSLNIDSRGYYSFFISRKYAPKYVFKLFPNEWIYQTTQDQKRLIIDEILYWDGNSVPNRAQIEYSSKEYHNATFIQTISSLCGYCSTIMRRQNQFGKWFKVSILFNKNSTNSQGLRDSQKMISYNGLVYCLTVDSGMLFIRQNDCISVSGNCDALASYEAGFGNDYEAVANDDGEVVEHELGRWAVLSVPNGASKGSQRMEYLDNCSDWLTEFDEFIIAVDNDEAGKSLQDELVRRLGAEKCRIVEYPTEVVPSLQRSCKDMNEVLIHFGKEQVIQTILNAKLIPVDGIYYLDDVFPQMIDRFRKGVMLGETTRFGEFDKYFRWKKGDINVIIGYANAGKTTFWLQMMLTKSIFDGWKWAIFSPENYPANDFYDDLVEMYVGKWIPDMTEDEYIDACLFLDLHFFYVYPEWEHDLESIHEKFRYLILKKGVDGVLIDPFNQLDKTQKAYERDDQYISNTLKDVKRFALLNAVSYNIIMHPKSPTYNQDKSLPPADMYDIAGGAMTGNKSDQIISYYRPNFHIDKNDANVDIILQKVKRKRTGGSLGTFSIRLNWKTKRYEDIFGSVFCDPKKAEQKKFQEQNGLLPDNQIDNGIMPF